MSVIFVSTLVPRQFKGDENLTEIKLGNSIQIIPRECFQGCINLKRIVIPRSVKRIDFKSFLNSGLEEVIFETDSSLRVISTRSFESCLRLKSITLPPTIRIIGDFSFQHCLMLKTCISITGTTSEIGVFAFANCGIDHLDINTSETSYKSEKKFNKNQEKIITLNIGYGSFQDCLNLHTLNLPSHLDKNTPASAEFQHTDTSNIHRNNSNYASPSILHQPFTPPSITLINHIILNIGIKAFLRCTNLKSVTIFSCVKAIGRNAFEKSGIESIEFSQISQLEILPTYIFSGCSNLHTVSLPSSIKVISPCAFAWSAIDDKSLANIFENCNIRCIRELAFMYCKNFQTISFPSSLNSLGRSIFSKSTVKNITFPKDSNLKYIYHEAFSGCIHLNTFVPPPLAKLIGVRTFFSSNIDDKLFDTIFTSCAIEHIGNAAFSYCKRLRTITIPSSVTSIHRRAFSSAYIENVYFSPNSQLQILPEYIFSYCLHLKIISLPPSIISIANFAFIESGIDDVMLTTIFTNCNIQHIGESAFSNCKNLRSIIIPPSVKFIGISAFSGTNIEKVEFLPGSQLANIPDYVFKDCLQLKVVILPLSLISIGKQSFTNGVRFSQC